MKKSSPSHSLFKSRLVLLAGAAITLAVLTQLNGELPAVVGPYYMRMVMLSGIAIILAVSLNLVNGFAGQFSLGHAGFYAIGAYSSAVLTHYCGDRIVSGLRGTYHLPASTAAGILMLLAILVAVIAASAAGLLVGLPSLRLRGDYLAIATLGFGEATRVIIQNTQAVGAQRGFDISRGASASLRVALSHISDANFTWIFAFVVLVIAFSRNLALSSHGMALFAIRDDEIAAESTGVNVFRYKLMAFAMSAAWAGVAGALIAHYEGFLVPKSFDFMKSVDIVVMVVLGGGGSITGAAVAAVALTSLPILLQDYLPPNLQNIRMVVYAVLLVALMLTRPQGIFGRSELSLMNFLKRVSKSLEPKAAAAKGGEPK